MGQCIENIWKIRDDFDPEGQLDSIAPGYTIHPIQWTWRSLKVSIARKSCSIDHTGNYQLANQRTAELSVDGHATNGALSYQPISDVAPLVNAPPGQYTYEIRECSPTVETVEVKGLLVHNLLRTTPSRYMRLHLDEAVQGCWLDAHDVSRPISSLGRHPTMFPKIHH